MFHFMRAVCPIRWERLTAEHPCLCGLLLMAGLPVGMLLTLFLSTAAIMAPIALLMGWVC